MKWNLSALFLSLFLFAGCTETGVWHGMEKQPKVKPLQPSEFWQDGRSARPAVPGTVARGHLEDDTLLYTGKINGKDSTVFPFPITKAVLERGRERFDIYCSVCHDRLGTGNGMIVRRGFPHPPSYHIDRLRNAPVGHYFDVITNGFGRMYSYNDRVNAQDRWAIIAYIRTLQVSQRASLTDIPEAERRALEEKK